MKVGGLYSRDWNGGRYGFQVDSRHVDIALGMRLRLAHLGAAGVRLRFGLAIWTMAWVLALNGFAGTVNFTVTGLPPGAAGSFSPASVAGSGTSTLSVSTSTSTPAGTYTLTECSYFGLAAMAERLVRAGPAGQRPPSLDARLLGVRRSHEFDSRHVSTTSSPRRVAFGRWPGLCSREGVRAPCALRFVLLVLRVQYKFGS